MLLDLEGQIVIVGKPIFAILQKSQTAEVMQAPAPCSTPDALQSCPTRWQGKVARLCRRVQEVQILILEDMQEVQEPLDALSNEGGILSSQETVQLEMAKATYKRAIQECDRVLASILEPFTEAQGET